MKLRNYEERNPDELYPIVASVSPSNYTKTIKVDGKRVKVKRQRFCKITKKPIYRLDTALIEGFIEPGCKEFVI